jgi:hypothetical protein
MNGASPNLRSSKPLQTVISLWSKSTTTASVSQLVTAGRRQQGNWGRLAPDDIVARFEPRKAQIARGGEDVKPECVLVAMVTCLIVTSVTPALAAPRQVEEFCFEQARQYVTGDPYRRGAWEAAIANCIANLTPTPTERRRYRKYRKY